MRFLHRGALGSFLISACASLVVAGTPDGASAQRARAGSDTIANADSLAGSRAPSPYGGGVIIPDSIDRAPLTSMSDMLQSRVPGLSVQRISGASGSASRIRLRGTRSALFSSAPLVIVDGLRMDVGTPRFYTLPSSTLRLDVEWLSRLDDLDPEDIERVEVLRGPAAASRFGRGATNGAILVTTKRGAPGGFRWGAHTSFGSVNQAVDFPTSYDQRGIDRSSGEHIDHCGIIPQARRTCTTIFDSLLSSNALEQHSPFRTGTRSQLGLGGRGGNDWASIYLAGNFTRENGTLDINDVQRNHVLASGTVRPFSWLEIGGRAGYTRGSFSGIAPKSEPSFMISGLGGGPDGVQGYLTPPDSIELLAAHRGAARLIAGGMVALQPVRWFRLAGTIGTDRDRWVDDKSVPSWGDVLARQRTAFSTNASTARVEATTSWRIGGAFHLGSSIGFERLKEREEGRSTLVHDGDPNSHLTSTDAFWTNYRLDGTFGQLDLAWKDRVSITGGVRHERIRYGPDATTYPSIGIAWQLSNEPWFPRGGALSKLRIHYAYGEAAQSRAPLDLELVSSMRMPDARESEAGLDAEVLGGRATLALTYYRGRGDEWSLAYGPPSSPNSPYVSVPRSVHSGGIEAALSTIVVEDRELSVKLDATVAFPRSRFEGRQTYLGSLSFAPQRLTAGYPVAGYWAAPILGYQDIDRDGSIGTLGCTANEFPSAPICEVQLGDVEYLGSSVPTREFSLRPRATRGRLTLSALFDYRGGNKLFNFTEYARCSYLEVCLASQDRRAPLADQARVAAAMLGSPAGYIEDASFWKFRELSLALAAPERWAAKVGARRLTLTLAGRNLATWTRYGGADPEVSSEGYESLLAIDYFAQPAVRYFIMRLDVGW